MTKERIARWTIYVLLSIGIAYIGVDLACLEISDNCTYYEVQALINNRTELIGCMALGSNVDNLRFWYGNKRTLCKRCDTKNVMFIHRFGCFFSYRCFDCLYIEL